MIKISVYTDDGLVFEYEVASPSKARVHAAAIIRGGYRSTPVNSDALTWYPPHRIDKVVADGAGEGTKYRDKVRPT